MPENQTRLEYLYDCYIEDAATPEEAAEFWQLFRRAAANDPVMEAIFQKYNEAGPIGKAAGMVDWQKMLDRALGRSRLADAAMNEAGTNGDAYPSMPEQEGLSGMEQQEVLPPIRPYRRYRLAIAAAAAVLLLLGTTWWYKQYNASHVSVVAKAPTAEPRPGHSGAILTLAQGQQVVLDSMANGNIAVQGNSRIIKIDGKLAYNKEDNNPAVVTYNTLTVPRGRQFQLLLPDSTKVWLNSASSIRFPTAFTGANRDITLTGEAYFEVAHNASQPFRVQIGEQRIDVLGTSFNINGYEDEVSIRTTLLQGSIQVSGREHAPVRLHPGEQAMTDKDGKWQLKKVNTEEVVAWKEGWFRFEGNSVPLIMRQLSRWYDVDVLYEGTPPAVRIGGEVPRDMQLSKVLDVLRISGVNIEYKDGKIVVRP